MRLGRAAALGVLGWGAGVAAAGDILLELGNYRDRDATVHAELHAASSPDWTTPLARTAATAGSLRFRDIAPGRYAVQLFVDRDGDGVLAVTPRDIPTEPVGFSTNPSLVNGKPPPGQTAFDHGATESSIVIRLRESRRRE